jgi:hypothetical protein
MRGCDIDHVKGDASILRCDRMLLVWFSVVGGASHHLFYMLHICRSTPGATSSGRIVGDVKAFGQFKGRVN